MANNTSVAHLKSDPLRNFKFQVSIHNPNHTGFLNAGFMSVSGLNISTEVIPYREGGMNTTTQKMPGQSDFAPLTLSKGLMIGDHSMINWVKDLFSVIQGDGSGAPGQDFRARVIIKVYDHPVTSTTNVPVKAAWRVYNAWPSAVAFSDLDAGANAILISQMTLAHEGWEAVVSNKLGTDSVSFSKQ